MRRPFYPLSTLLASTLLLTSIRMEPTLAAPSSLPTWETAFGDPHAPLHLTASYSDAQGKPQTLEFWRDAKGRVVRRTGNRAELRLTPAPDGEDQYQLRNLVDQTAFDVHRVNLLRVGVFTDRWSVQHLLDRPTGAYTLVKMGRRERTAVGDCIWWQLSPASGKASELCWSTELGVPLKLRVDGRQLLTVNSVQPLSGFPTSALPAGWQEYNADEDLAPD